MHNRYGDADAELPACRSAFKPGYLSYLETLCSLAENPSSMILSACEGAALTVVRACGAVLGPVYHLADPEHVAIRAVAARLDTGGPALAIAAGRIWLTTAGGDGSCPFCAVFGPAGATARGDGACPVLAGRAPACTDLLAGPVLATLHALIGEICDMASVAGIHPADGYTITLQARMPDLPRSWSDIVDLAGVGIVRRRG